MPGNEGIISVTPLLPQFSLTVKRKYFAAQVYNLREQIALFVEEENLVRAEHLRNIFLCWGT
jgi:hypothetical protein